MSIFDPILDGTIYYSFDASGFRRHQKNFVAGALEVSMHGKVCIVTGANSGLGFETAKGLAARGAKVHMVCRNPERGQSALESIREENEKADLHLALVDVSDPDSIRGFVAQFTEPGIDVLVHNAGLLPRERIVTSEGFELAVATHVLGPHLMTRLLQDKLKGGRLIWVSSGGMYGKRFDLKKMLSLEGTYDGVSAYAMTKRAQVMLSALWADELAHQNTMVNAMHPGWAATPGVESSLPGFWKKMEKKLRSPKEGADTALWLAVADSIASESGSFWFDRRAVRTNLVWWTRAKRGAAEALWSFCEEQAGR
jgi:dehydrogenase/reductase SDR family protein 12